MAEIWGNIYFAHRYSALKMDGRPLYDYARTNTPLPRPIEPRKCTISELVLEDWTEGGKHDYKYPDEELGEDEKASVDRLESMVKESLEGVGSKAAVAVDTPRGSSSGDTGGEPIQAEHSMKARTLTCHVQLCHRLSPYA
jgi:tRNA pseudouridine55 synthase